MRRGLALAAALGAAGLRARRDVRRAGVVRAVRAEERQVTIEHGDIAGLMPAMTMSFDVADAALLAGLAPGQYVEFRIARAGERFEIVALEAPGAASAGVAGVSAAAAIRSRPRASPRPISR